MESALHLHEFFVEGSNPEISHVLLNITEPSTPTERDKGYFFAICEINNANTKYIAKMQSIIDEIENNYYEIPDRPGQSAMELVLEKVNQESFSMVQPEIGLHCIVGAIRENDIIFSFYGDPQMLLFYRAKDGLYKKMDLVEQNKSNEQDGQQNQLFSQIVQGKIGANDFFFAGTSHIEEYFNHDRLQKIITTRPPRQSSEHLQRVLSEIKNNFSFGGIIINLQPEANPAPAIKPAAQKGDAGRSLKNLFSTERNTAHILSPSFLPRFPEKTEQAANEEAMPAAKENHRANAEITSSHLHARVPKTSNKIRKDEKLNLEDFVKKTSNVIWVVLKYVSRALIMVVLFIWSIISALGRNFLLLFFVITNYKNRRHNILLQWAKWWQNLKENIIRLPLITKILLSLSLILLLTFSGGIMYVGAKQKKQARAAAYTSAVQNIQTKADSAESSLVYNDTNAALAGIQEAQKILKELSCVSTSEKATCQSLQERLNSILIKARKITIIHPELLVDWTSLSTSTIDNIFLLNNKIYGFGQANANVALYDPLIKESKLIAPSISVNNFTAVSVPKENDYAALLYDNKNIAQFNPQDNSWKKIEIGYPNENAHISAVSVYNRRLYSLDTQNNQIYRHDAIKTGFGLGNEWLKNDINIDLKTGVDITVDGDVFVLGQNGTVNKFTTGTNQPFNISGLDPALTSADEIWTYNDINYIYILDAANKRIIVLDKTGQLKTQITANEFSQPTSMIVDEAKGVAYILDSNKVYLIEL